MTLSAGRLRHRVRIERNTSETLDSEGRRLKPGWRSLATVWAAIEPLSARDAIVAAETASKVIARIVIRARDDIDATMRVVHGTTIYNITGILRDRDSGIEYMTLPVTAGVNEG